MKTKKFLAALLSAAMVVTSAAIPVLAENAVDTWDGTADISWYTEDPNAATFTIDSAADLAGLAKIVNGNADIGGAVTFEGKTVNLAADIDLDNKEWTPIGGGGGNFRGTFEGNNWICQEMCSQNLPKI